MKLSKGLSEKVFEITTEEETLDWIAAVEKEIGGVVWVPVGSPGIEGNPEGSRLAMGPLVGHQRADVIVAHRRLPERDPLTTEEILARPRGHGTSTRNRRPRS